MKLKDLLLESMKLNEVRGDSVIFDIQQLLKYNDPNVDLGTSGKNGDGVDGVFGTKTKLAIHQELMNLIGQTNREAYDQFVKTMKYGDPRSSEDPSSRGAVDVNLKNKNISVLDKLKTAFKDSDYSEPEGLAEMLEIYKGMPANVLQYFFDVSKGGILNPNSFYPVPGNGNIEAGIQDDQMVKFKYNNAIVGPGGQWTSDSGVVFDFSNDDLATGEQKPAEIYSVLSGAPMDPMIREIETEDELNLSKLPALNALPNLGIRDADNIIKSRKKQNRFKIKNILKPRTQRIK